MHWRMDKIFYIEMCDLNKKFLQIFYEQKFWVKQKFILELE